jgi:hypothetical protein
MANLITPSTVGRRDGEEGPWLGRLNTQAVSRTLPKGEGVRTCQRSGRINFTSSLFSIDELLFTGFFSRPFHGLRTLYA